MTIITTDSAICWAPQAGTAPGDDTTSKYRDPSSDGDLYRWVPATRITMAPVQAQAPLPPELSGALLPRGAYKGGMYVAGAVDFIPRVEGSHLHWLLNSFASSYVGYEKTAGVEYHHYYGTGDDPIATWDESSWTDGSEESTGKDVQGGGPNNTDYFLSLRRLLPPPQSDETLTTRPGEAFEDCRVAQLDFTARPGQPLGCTASFVGRKGTFVPDTSAGASTYWKPNYTATASGYPGLQSTDSILLGCRGELNLPHEGTSLDLTTVDVRLTLSANMTTPDQEMVMFSYYPETFRILNRAAAVSFTIKKNVFDMYRNIFFGGGSSWSPVVWRSGEPLQMIFKTPSDTIMGGGTIGGELHFWAQDMLWQMTPITYGPGQILGATITGIVLEPTNGAAAWYLMVKNDRSPDVDEAGAASSGFYTWPTS